MRLRQQRKSRNNDLIRMVGKTTMENVIETNQLTRKYGKLDAVHDLTISVPNGSVLAFLGPNGAGKTTTIRMLMNIIEPTSGSSSVLGVDSRRLGPAQLQQIGYVAADQRMPDWMTIRDFLAYCRPMYPTWDDGFAQSLLKQYALPPDQKLANLSRGMRMKAMLISSLAYRPRLLILDEPFAGLDPLVRDEFVQGILELTEQDRWTIFISSHDIEEVERLADRICIVNEGRLCENESVESLQARFRLVQVMVRDGDVLPAKLPAHWLVAEQQGNMLRFVDSRYSEANGEKFWRSQLPASAQIEAKTMSLREIFLALARTYRPVTKEERP
jgi:ABC-2 type transport system ATP-binding protein